MSISRRTALRSIVPLVSSVARYRVEKVWLALSFGALTALGQGQEPGRTSREARGRGRLAVTKSPLRRSLRCLCGWLQRDISYLCRRCRLTPAAVDPAELCPYPAGSAAASAAPAASATAASKEAASASAATAMAASAAAYMDPPSAAAAMAAASAATAMAAASAAAAMAASAAAATCES
jgi:hypothetical protein